MIFNHNAETAPQAEREKLQSERLRETVERVYNKVPFYKNKLNELRVAPEEISDIEDIQKLPFTVKQDLRDNYPFSLFAVDRCEVVRLHASSGTSGKPTVVGYTKKDIEVWSEVVARAIAAGGGEPGGVLHNAYGYGLFTGGLGLHYGSEKLGMATVPVSGGNTERQILLIEDFKPKVICGTPSYILNIIETMERMGKDPRGTSLEYGIFGAEPWSEKMRAEIEQRMGIKACDIYGLSEVIGPGVAMECHEDQNGLHVMEDHFYVEVIDPDTLAPVPDGEYGELVFTTLTKEAMPVLRYRTGDIGAITRGTCSCGRTTVKMSRVKGRRDDMLIIRGVNVFPSEIENHLLKVEGLVPHYQLELTRVGPLDQVCLNVELDDERLRLCKQQDPDFTKMRREIQHVIKNNCLVSIDVKIKDQGSIPRSEGKAVRIIDNRFEKSPI